jgi:hypothetical protein
VRATARPSALAEKHGSNEVALGFPQIGGAGDCATALSERLWANYGQAAVLPGSVLLLLPLPLGLLSRDNCESAQN